jgi:hypothetical protein
MHGNQNERESAKMLVLKFTYREKTQSDRVVFASYLPVKFARTPSQSPTKIFMSSSHRLAKRLGILELRVRTSETCLSCMISPSDPQGVSSSLGS